MTATALDRLLAKTTPGPNGCIIFTGSTIEGYGQIFVDGRRELVHRVAHLLLVGEVPEGLKVTHSCHQEDTACPGGKTCLHRRCINPAHLAVADQATASRGGRSRSGRNAAKTHCPQGHPYDAENTSRSKDGARNCRTCHRERARTWKAQARQRAVSREVELRETFAALYAAQQGFVTGVVLAEVRDRNFALAEDLTADAFIRAWKAWPACRATTDAQRKAWLRTIARHTVIDYYRVKRNTAETATDPTAWQYANQPVEQEGGCFSVRSGRHLTPA
ncbi:sigma factor [Streptomyces drozdowiczii]|uniref:sigma factor n=1 Tax=Streptomyces drozdowiczii TaxID=202862 RepID=UPI00403CB621